ncbi:MAG: hypothetical protein GXO37_02125 [Chloroflexi bacterium]|nr:hypothetical protein [Chloroflexota bacterium]
MTWMTVLFGVLVAATLAAGMHLRWGRGCVTLGIYTLVAEISFWAGHWAAGRQGWNWGRWGALALGPALLAALAAVGLAAFLLYVPPPSAETRKPPTR